MNNLTALQYLALSNNELRGVFIDVFPASLEEIHLENNYLRGTAPDSLKSKADAGTKVYLQNNYLTGANLLNMENNEKNFTDGASTEQYQLTSSSATIQIYGDRNANIYPFLQNKSYKDGSTSKVTLLPEEYTIAYDTTKINTVTADNGIFITALEEIPLSDGFTITITIKDNTGSGYSTLALTLTTDTVSGPGGSAGSGTPGEAEPETETHEPYINGYPDGSFRPDNQISREEVAAMLIAALDEGESTASSPSYTDVAVSRWSFGYIERATELGYLNGYGGGVFNPGASMTRAELAAALVRIAEARGDTPGSGSADFSDVSGGEWYGEYVEKAAGFGLVTGYADGTFRPESTVSRAEAVTMINRMLGRDPETAQALQAAENPFNDVSRSHWAYLHILEAALTHEH